MDDQKQGAPYYSSIGRIRLDLRQSTVCISDQIGALVPVLVLAGLLFHLSGSRVRLKEGQPFRMQGVCGSEQAGMKAANDRLYLPPGVVVLRPHKSSII